MTDLRLERLNASNFSDYEKLTREESNGKTGCYCAFWHQKFNSREEWDHRQKEEPQKNCEVVRTRMESGFHVGVLAYEGSDLVAWISVGPLNEFYWTSKRLAQIGNDGLKTAGITCINLAERHRGQGKQALLLKGLIEHGKRMGWDTIEGYPFDEAAFQKHGAAVAWPGHHQGFMDAGFIRIADHWLSQGDYPRSIFSICI